MAQPQSRRAAPRFANDVPPSPGLYRKDAYGAHIPYDVQKPGGGPPPGFPIKDGPLADAIIREPVFSESMHVLHTYLDPRSDVLVSGDTFIYYRDPLNRRRAIAPDCYAIFGPNLAQYRNRYGLSLGEVGKAPDFVMEVASPSTWRADLGYKRRIYHRIGVGEYWLYDPDGGRYYGAILAWERLENGEYRRKSVQREADGMVWAHSPALALDVCADGERLRFFNPATGEYLHSLAEEQAARAAAEAARMVAEAGQTAAEVARAAAEAAQADERAARESAEAEIRRLQAELQRLREGPSSAR